MNRPVWLCYQYLLVSLNLFDVKMAWRGIVESTMNIDLQIHYKNFILNWYTNSNLLSFQLKYYFDLRNLNMMVFFN